MFSHSTAEPFTGLLRCPCSFLGAPEPLRPSHDLYFHLEARFSICFLVFACVSAPLPKHPATYSQPIHNVSETYTSPGARSMAQSQNMGQSLLTPLRAAIRMHSGDTPINKLDSIRNFTRRRPSRPKCDLE